MASKTEIRMAIRERFPDIADNDLETAVDYFVENPEQFNPRDIVLPISTTVLEGGASSSAKGAALAAGKVAKSVFARKTAAKKAEEAVAKTKGGMLKKAAKGSLLATGAYAGIQLVDKLLGNDEGASLEEEQLIAQQASQDLVATVVTAQQQGVDVSSVMNTPAGKQLFTQAGIDPKLLAASGFLSTGGVYTGKPITISTYPSEGGGKPTYVTKDTVSTTEWANQFPIADPKKLAEWKNTLVRSGVVDASAGIGELQKQWNAWGELSQQMNRAGNKLSPYQLLEIQRGLWGGGGGGGPSYSTQLIKKENAMTMFKQGIENLTGRVIDDAEAEDFANLVRKRQLKKPTKTSQKMVGGKKVTVTEPGFGEAEAAALVEKRAQQDPMFAEFQTANVFGSALEKALGVRG